MGLAHALAAAKLGKRVVVIDRDAQANGASIRNFGFITVSGQAQQEVWPRARRSRDIWAAIAPELGLEIDHRGLVLVVRRPQSRAVVEAFLATEMGRDCQWLSPAQAAQRLGAPLAAGVEGGLYSPHELRVESVQALPALANWLADRWGVQFQWSRAVHAVRAGEVQTARGPVEAEAVVVCPGDDLSTLYPDLIASRATRRCRLSMLRLADPGFRLGTGVMSDLGLVRYRGYADLPAAVGLLTRLQKEQAQHLAHGVHLIAVQSRNGSLVVGDSHHYADTPDPFALSEIEDLILDEYSSVFGTAPPPVVARWTGTYASGAGPALIAAPEPGVRLVMVTEGNGASTAFGLGEQVIGELYGVGEGASA